MEINIINKKLIIVSGLFCLAVLVFQLVNPFNAYAATRVCSGGNCWYVACNSNSDCGTNGFTGSQYCQGNNIYQNYITYTCNNWGSAYSSCTSSTTSKSLQTCSSDLACVYGKCTSPSPTTSAVCTSHVSQKCVGNYVYWFNSCGKQEDLYKACGYNQVCSNNACATSYTATGYISHSLKGCVNNNVYWYDSLGNQQDLYQNCAVTGQICQNSQCTGQVYYAQPSQFQKIFIKHYNTKCYSNDIYWYDSDGKIQDIYKSCSDDNQCTSDNCKDDGCINTLKCDDSTCSIDSQDYMKYCKNNQNQAATQKTQENKPEDKSNTNIAAALGSSSNISLFKKWYIWAAIAIISIFLFIVIFRKLSSNV